MNMLLGFGKTYLWWIVGIVFALLLTAYGVQTIRVAGLQADVAEEKQARSDENTDRMRTALAYQKYIDGLEEAHAASQQQKENEYAKSYKKLQEVRAADLASNERLRRNIAAFTAGDRRPGESDSSALKRSADRLKIVGALLETGARLVTESLGIIGGRDLEVRNVVEQNQIDRAACSVKRNSE